jgi:hypothetical protein
MAIKKVWMSESKTRLVEIPNDNEFRRTTATADASTKRSICHASNLNREVFTISF